MIESLLTVQKHSSTHVTMRMHSWSTRSSRRPTCIPGCMQTPTHTRLARQRWRRATWRSSTAARPC